jgi:hypothetical protein
MKRLSIAAALLLAIGLTAYADTSVYISRPQKSDAGLQAVTEMCDQQVGVVRNGAIPSLAYKRCIEHFG